MPLVALDFGRGKVLSIDEALEAASRGELDGEGWTYELVAALLNVQQDRGDRISTTTLTAKCPRSEVLKRKTEYVDSPAKLWAAFRGTMFHGQLEWNAHPANIAEARYYVTLANGDEVTGSPDLVSPYLGRLYDYKTNKENPRYDKPWEDHIMQVQINRWLVDQAHTVEYQGEHFPLTGKSYVAGKSKAADRAAFRARFVPARWDSLWLVYLDDKGPKPIKVTRSEQVPAKNGGTKSARVADIWEDDRVERIVTRLYAERKEALSGNNLPPIPPGYERQGHVLCQYCPVKDLCWDLAMKGQ